MFISNRIHKDLAKLFKKPPPDCILDTGDEDEDNSLSTDHGTSSSSSSAVGSGSLTSISTPTVTGAGTGTGSIHSTAVSGVSPAAGDSSLLSTVTFYLLGPESTAYYGGAWKVKLKIPQDYPRQAPKAFFVTKIFHPNVQPSTGEVCVDTLKRDWSSDVDLSHIILVSLHELIIEYNNGIVI